MLLSDIDIKKALKSKKIIIKPIPKFIDALSPCSLDLSLANEFKIFEYTRLPFVDTRDRIGDELTKVIKVKKGDPFIMQPGEFVLGATAEWIELPDNIAARLEGRSSLGRLGIVVHSTAALVHPGFRGNIVLELGNHSRMPVALYPGMRMCALSFELLTTPAEVPYWKQKDNKYLNQKGVVGSLIDKE
jgi:dCTP deaminase